MMKINLSETLVRKLRLLTGMMLIGSDREYYSYNCQDGYKHSIPGDCYICVCIHLDDHLDPEYDKKECFKWLDYNTVTLQNHKIDIGKFNGLYPIEIGSNFIIFSCDNAVCKQSWEDWFMVDKEGFDASSFSFELLSNI